MEFRRLLPQSPMSSDQVDEEAPLPAKQRTALPWSQFSLVLFLLLAEPLAWQVVYPFTPQVCFHDDSHVDPASCTRFNVSSFAILESHMGMKVKWDTTLV
jgi:hypothetical protein